ncbi:MAG: TonB-dependent receptor plug domain-containing protein [Nitrospiraceae bacterium]|nr:TonB-dependent receptor plug domain-containing protein [Nitrospiraceae bacterium]
MRAVKILMIITISFICASQSFAGNTGKISGTVTDKQTGEPLIGANVRIKGTRLGAAADLKGRYFILQVPPGTYEVVANYIGYHVMRVKNVKVFVDLTTRIDFKLTSEAIKFPNLVVIAKEPMVQPDITSTRQKTTREEIKATPGMERSADIFKLYGGAIVDAAPQTLQLENGVQLQVRDESLKNIHIRGGRGGEILYLVDGMPVTHPIYGGRDVLDLNVVDVQEVELLTGAFNAEYGQAQSGVVNITTRSGGYKFRGGVQYKTDRLRMLGESYDKHYATLYMGGPDPISNRLLPSIGVNIPGKIYYFISTDVDLTNTPYDNHRNRGKMSIFGLKIGERQNNTGNLNTKINWQISNATKLVFNYHGTWLRWDNFNWLWKYYPNHIASYLRNNNNASLQFVHTLSKSTYYTLNLGYLSVAYQGSFNGKRPTDFWSFFKDGKKYNYSDYVNHFTGAPDSLETSIKEPEVDPLNGFYDKLGFENIWRNDFTRTYTFKGDITSQINSKNLVKSGIEVNYNDLQYVDIQDAGVKLSNYGMYRFKHEAYFPAPPGPFKELGQNRWVFYVKPLIGGAYLQDKIETQGLIINAGVRLDWFVPGKSIRRKAWKEAWQAATGLKPNWSWLRYKISPRFGISFPISVKTVVYFSYGHFNQLPELQFFYRDPYTGSFTGNPHLDYVQTILYEFGFTHRLAKNWAIDIKSYTKDISKQVGTTQLRAALGLPVYLYDNNGYGRARGIEFDLRKRYSHFTSGRISYTVQWANGYSSSAFEDYIRSINDFPKPIRERRLNWDIRHQVVLQAAIASPENRHMHLFGLTIPDKWDITILSRFSSGQPYTPGTHDPVVAQKTENSKTGPPSMTVDLKINKSFNVANLKLSVFADIFNALNLKNVQIAYGFNPWTGKPFKYGDKIQDTHQYYNWYTMYRLMDPRQFSTGRHANIGLRIDW